MSQVLIVIGYKKTKLDKLRLEVIKRGITSERYKRYNDEAYEDKYLKQDIIMEHKRKIIWLGV